MASVSRAAKVPVAQRVFAAFKEWYIYAAGYRQIGK